MGDGGEIRIIGVNIPQSAASYEEFENAMKRTENVLREKLIDIQIH